jgi:hypothetical protein
MFKQLSPIESLQYLSRNQLAKDTIISTTKYNLFKKFILKFLNSFILDKFKKSKGINLKSKLIELNDYNAWCRYYNKFLKIVNELINNHIDSKIKKSGFRFRNVKFDIHQLYTLLCNYMNITSNYFDDELYLPSNQISNITDNDRMINPNTNIRHIWFHIFFKYQYSQDYFDKSAFRNFYSDISILFTRLYIEQLKKVLTTYQRSSKLISSIISSKHTFNKDVSQSILQHLDVNTVPRFTSAQIKSYVFTKRPDSIAIKKQINLSKFNKLAKIIKSPNTKNTRKYKTI